MEVVRFTCIALLASTQICADGNAPIASTLPDIAGSQVTFVTIVSAQFYCSRGRWPATVAELLKFRTATKVLPAVKVAEGWLLGPDVTLATEPTYYLRARNFVEGKWLVLESRQDVPLCQAGESKLKGASMHMNVEPVAKGVSGGK
jgi:hypothetical protein